MRTIYCPQCHQKYEIDDSVMGCNVQCEVCGTKFVIQESDVFNKTEKEDYVLCPHCKKENIPSNSFCVFCGKEIVRQRYCRSCNAPVTAEARFCHNCGAELYEDNVYHVNPSGKNPKVWNKLSAQVTGDSVKKVRMQDIAMRIKKNWVPYVSGAFVMIVILIMMIAKVCSSSSSNSSPNVKKSSYQDDSRSTASDSYSSTSRVSSNTDAQKAEEAMLMLMLMGAAAQQQSSRGGGSYGSSLPVVCTACGGLGYQTDGLGLRKSCYKCGGTGYQGANNPWDKTF